jgi:hypothetical protein
MSELAQVVSALFFVGAYFYGVWDNRKAAEDASDDQIMLKVVLFTLAIGALGIAAAGLDTLISAAATGAKDTGLYKMGTAKLVSGAAVLAGIAMVLLPRTNNLKFPLIFRVALGFVGTAAGLAAILAFEQFATNMIAGEGEWANKAQPLGGLITMGGIAFASIRHLGQMSGWTAPVRPVAAAPVQQHAPQASGGYPQPGGPMQGMPPQGGGYPPQGMPQGGGYPPQGGGYPPQGGGYPPQGGGYPPQGGQGGGYPPR